MWAGVGGSCRLGRLVRLRPFLWCDGRGVIRRNVCGEKEQGEVPEIWPQVGGQDPNGVSALV